MSRREPAHPRSRGADIVPVSHTYRTGGSSPLARGGRRGAGVAQPGVGLIPARAGRTPLQARDTTQSGAHPRSRGADVSRRPVYASDSGSSPLARGGRRLAALLRWFVRLIPARASRGADRQPFPPESVGKGSSPLARGGRGHRTVPCLRRWLIPARAGRTRRSLG